MPVVESKKVEKDSVISKEPAEETTVSDIENVLDFLDSDEYQEVRQPIPPAKTESKKQSIDKARHDASKPLTSALDAVKISQQKNSTIRTTPVEKATSRSETKPTKDASESHDGPKSKTSDKIWYLCLGAAVLIFLAVLILYNT